MAIIVTVEGISYTDIVEDEIKEVVVQLNAVREPVDNEAVVYFALDASRQIRVIDDITEYMNTPVKDLQHSLMKIIVEIEQLAPDLYRHEAFVEIVILRKEDKSFQEKLYSVRYSYNNQGKQRKAHGNE